MRRLRLAPAVGQAGRDAGLALLPGEATGGEILQAQEDGFTERKFFPAMLRVSSGPFFDVKFCPVGGVTLQNASEFLAPLNLVCEAALGWSRPTRSRVATEPG